MKTAVEWLVEELWNEGYFPYGVPEDIVKKAKEMEKEQLFLAANTSAKEAYKAGQTSMYCGCYEYDGCTTYEEWLYKKFKSEE
jgi:hypothetical protein